MFVTTCLFNIGDNERKMQTKASLVTPPNNEDNMSKTVDVETLRDIRRICEIVLNNAFGNSELDSLALYVGHHPLVLNSDTSKQTNKQTKEQKNGLFK